FREHVLTQDLEVFHIHRVMPWPQRVIAGARQADGPPRKRRVDASRPPRQCSPMSACAAYNADRGAGRRGMALPFAATAGTVDLAALDTRQRRRESLSSPAQETPVRECTHGAGRGGVDDAIRTDCREDRGGCRRVAATD